MSLDTLSPLSDLSPLADISGAAVTAAVGAVADAATGGAAGFASGFLAELFGYNGISIILGLLLIAAGLFSFRQVREYTGYAAKTAALAA